MDLVSIVSLLVTLVGVYLGIGLIFAFYAIFIALGKLDPAAKQGTIGFRLLVLPGMTVFWPLFLLRLVKGVAEPPVETNFHREHATGEEV